MQLTRCGKQCCSPVLVCEPRIPAAALSPARPVLVPPLLAHARAVMVTEATAMFRLMAADLAALPAEEQKHDALAIAVAAAEATASATAAKSEKPKHWSARWDRHSLALGWSPTPFSKRPARRTRYASLPAVLLAVADPQPDARPVVRTVTSASAMAVAAWVGEGGWKAVQGCA